MWYLDQLGFMKLLVVIHLRPDKPMRAAPPGYSKTIVGLSLNTTQVSTYMCVHIDAASQAFDVWFEKTDINFSSSAYELWRRVIYSYSTTNQNIVHDSNSVAYWHYWLVRNCTVWADSIRYSYYEPTTNTSKNLIYSNIQESLLLLKMKPNIEKINSATLQACVNCYYVLYFWCSTVQGNDEQFG